MSHLSRPKVKVAAPGKNQPLILCTLLCLLCIFLTLKQIYIRLHSNALYMKTTGRTHILSLLPQSQVTVQGQNFDIWHDFVTVHIVVFLPKARKCIWISYALTSFCQKHDDIFLTYDQIFKNFDSNAYFIKTFLFINQVLLYLFRNPLINFTWLGYGSNCSLVYTQMRQMSRDKAVVRKVN